MMDDVNRAENPRKNANCLSKFLLWYMNKTFTTGYRRRIDVNDIFCIQEENSSKVLCSKLDNIWEAEVKKKTNRDNGAEPSLFKAVLQMSKSRLFLIGFFLLLYQILCVVQCLFLREVMIIFETNGFTFEMNTIFWTLGIAGCLIFQHLFLNASHFIGLQIGVNMKCALVTMLYKKILQIPEGSVRAITTSHVSNLIADSNLLLGGFTHLNFIWISPLTFVGVFVSLWLELGIACLGGIGIVLLIFPCQMYLYRFIASSCGARTGKRESVMNEVIKLIQAVKMYCLETVFKNKISYLRKEEIRSSRKSTIASVITHSVSGVIWYLSSLLTFLIHLKLGGTLKISSLLFVITLSIILYHTLVSYFSAGIQSVRKLQSHLRKIQTFLNSGSFGHSYHTLSTLCGENIYIRFKNVTSSWFGVDMTTPSLQNVTFKVNKNNSLVIVVGPSGAGKTSVLLTIMNELCVTGGKANVNGSVSYAAQHIWLFPGTIKQNILFGNEYDKMRYEKVLYVCCLIDDFKALELGDSTLIGQSTALIGDELKGKICIARATYNQASIYLYDNLLSHVTLETGKKIFDRCMRGFLRNKIVLLVTNQIQYFDHASSILCMNRNGTSNFGPLTELSQQGVDIIALLQMDTHEKQWDEDSAIETDSSINSIDDEQAKSRILGGVSLAPSKSFTNLNINQHIQRATINNSVHSINSSGPPIGFWGYVLSSVGCFSLLLLISFHVIGQAILTFTDYYFLVWSSGDYRRFRNETSRKLIFDDKPNLNMYVCIGLVCICVLINLLQTLHCHLLMINSTCKIHNIMTSTLLTSPMSFFQSNSMKDISSRFTRDINYMDAYLPLASSENVQFVIFCMAVVVLNCMNLPILAAIFFPFVLIFYYLNRCSSRTLSMLRSLEAGSQTPLQTHISSTYIGITTIRAFGTHAYKKVLDEFYACQDHHSEAWWMTLLARIWVIQRKSFIIITVSILSFFAPIIASQHMTIDPIITSLSLIHVYTLNILFQFHAWKDYDIDMLMSCAQRLYEYVELENEPDDGESIGIRETWPEIGLITGEDASFSYSPVSPYVLRRLFFCIRPKEKIGIVGSPGAGKSSFLMMIFRMAKVKGNVCIDGYMISDLKLNDLRKTISIIPEDPVVFACSVRQNLDPFMKHCDSDIWEVLDDVQMKDLVMEYPQKLDTVLSMTRHSMQERKLLCLARVLLEKRKILLIDGAVPSSDNKTERIMQRTIREKFRDSTVIFVAYRLNTIMELDRVMVIDSGKIVEFDEPFSLLQNCNGYFRRLVDQAGKSEASRLEVLADEARKLRQVLLMQNQPQFPGCNLTTSRSKTEIVKHFGSKVIFETTL